MPLEDADYISQLTSANPTADDDPIEGDDHIRLIKHVLKTTFPSMDAPVTITPTEANLLDGLTGTVETSNNRQLGSRPVAGGIVTAAGGFPTGFGVHSVGRYAPAEFVVRLTHVASSLANIFGVASIAQGTFGAVCHTFFIDAGILYMRVFTTSHNPGEGDMWLNFSFQVFDMGVR